MQWVSDWGQHVLGRLYSSESMCVCVHAHRKTGMHVVSSVWSSVVVFKVFVPRDSAARLKWSVTGSSWCNGGDAADALLIGAYQVFLGKTPEAFVQPSANRGAVSCEDYKKTRVSFQQQSSLPKDDSKTGPSVLWLAWFSSVRLL